jgi:hypothetical protein
MTKTTVHKVRIYDAKTDEMIVSRRYATPEGAETMGGTIIEGSAVVIDLTELEPGREWTQRDFVPAPGSAKRG